MQEPTYHYASTLKKRGWNEKLIATLLGSPDKLADNPRFKCAAPARLYEHHRVITAESSPQFQAHFARRATTTARAQKAVQTKTDRLRAEIARIRITIPTLSEQQLLNRATSHYNRHQQDRAEARDWNYDYTPVGDLPLFSMPSAFRDRLCVNFLRHGQSGYDHILHKLTGRTGRAMAHELLFARVMKTID